jgi:hypothetical protein
MTAMHGRHDRRAKATENITAVAKAAADAASGAARTGTARPTSNGSPTISTGWWDRSATDPR